MRRDETLQRTDVSEDAHLSTKTVSYRLAGARADWTRLVDAGHDAIDDFPSKRPIDASPILDLEFGPSLDDFPSSDVQHVQHRNDISEPP